MDITDHATFQTMGIEHRGIIMGKLHDFYDHATKGNFSVPVGFTPLQLLEKLTDHRLAFLQGQKIPE